ncbi:MAG: fibronectin type III domain-containing protein [Cyclobacteriaceae bacterium]|nr:fibronectin type III domain-containing protein [Cyclobacteriaceae bacterium HetDA_MAG_MS6]
MRTAPETTCLVALRPYLFAFLFVASYVKGWGQQNILMFVSYENTYYSEYIVMYEALTAAGYNVEVRSSASGQASVYSLSGDIVSTSGNAEFGNNYAQFQSQFEDLFGSPWNEALNPTPSPALISLDGTIQEVADMTHYHALVIVGGTGALDYRLDGSYTTQWGNDGRMVPAATVENVAEHLNSLAVDALLNGKPVVAQCHGASLAPFFRVPGTEGQGSDGLGVSILEGQYATGYPEAETPLTLNTLGVTHRPLDRVVVSSPTTTWSNSESAYSKIITTRDWYALTVAHAAKTLINIIATYPQAEVLSVPIDVLVVHGGAVDPLDCHFGNTENDVPCNYNPDMPADYTAIVALLEANSANDIFDFNVDNINISGATPPEYIADSQEAIEDYLSSYDVVIFFKHFSTDVTDELELALVNYADNGGTVLGIHHGMYNQFNGDLEKDILTEQLFGSVAPLDGWSSSLGDFDIVNTSYGHFISTYGINYQATAPIASTSWSLSGSLLANTNHSHSYYQRFPIFEEVYGTYQLIPGQGFGNGINEVNTLLASTSSPDQQARITGFSKRFDPSLDGSEGQVICLVHGERPESYDIDQPYGQIIRNSVAWSHLTTEAVDFNDSLNPTDLQGQNITETSFELTWTAPVLDSGASVTYALYIDQQLEIENHVSTHHTFTNLSEGNSHTVTIQATTGAEVSAPVFIEISTANIPPTTPYNMTLNSVGETTAFISWNPSIDEASMPVSYQITGHPSGQESTTDTSFVLNNLEAGTDYSIQVRALDAVGNMSEDSEPLFLSTEESQNPGVVEPIAQLSSEFRNTADLAGWNRLFELESWEEDPFTTFESIDDSLHIIPSASTWWMDRIGGFTYKSVTGDFIVTSYLEVQGTDTEPFPVSAYSLSGLMVRAPQEEGYDALDDFVDGQQNYYNIILGNDIYNGSPNPVILRNNTINSLSTNPTTPVSGWQLELRMARIDNQLVSMYREPDGSWNVIEVITRNFPATLQIGVVAISDYFSAAATPPAEHNNNAIDGNQDLYASFDFIRFRRPFLVEGLEGTLDTLPESELISLFGLDIPELDTAPPSQPLALQADSITENSFVLNWQPSVDPEGGPVAYSVYVDGLLNNDTSVPSPLIGGLQPATAYNCAIVATDEAGNQSLASETLEVVTAFPTIPGDPLVALSDEFIDALSLSDFSRLYQVENWQEDPLLTYDIQSDHLVMEPSASTWWRDGVGPFAFKEITGNFVATSQVTISAVSGTPNAWFSLAGLMVRVPQHETYNAAQDFALGQQHYYDVLVGYTTYGPNLLYNSTVSSVSNNPVVGLGDYEAEVRIARLGNTLISLYRETGGEWQVIESVDRPDLDTTLQVGLVAMSDWQTVSNNSQAYFYNSTVQMANNDILAEFDYLRFNTPEIPAEFIGQEPNTLTPADLLSFLGFESMPEVSMQARAASPISDGNYQEPIVIYPNPARDVVEIYLPQGADQPVELYIHDIKGRILYSKKHVSQPIKLNVADWNRGLYLIRINNQVKKIVLE